MILILSSSPHPEGLTNQLAKAAEAACLSSGKEVIWRKLNELSLQRCQVCQENGWGACRDGQCCLDDSFNSLYEEMKNAEGVVLITPVYWSEPSEPMKIVLDRTRRCAAISGALKEKPFVYVAAAGGSGNGTVATLEIFERWNRHIGAKFIDYITATRLTREYKIETVAAACRLLCAAPKG